MVSRLLIPLSRTQVSLSQSCSLIKLPKMQMNSKTVVKSWAQSLTPHKLHVNTPGILAFWRSQQEDQKFKIFGGYIVSPETAWTTWNPISKKKFFFKTADLRGCRDLSGQEHWLLMQRTLCLPFLAPTGRLTYTYSMVQGNPVPSLSNCGHCLHTVHMHTVKQNTPMHKVKRIFKKNVF